MPFKSRRAKGMVRRKKTRTGVPRRSRKVARLRRSKHSSASRAFRHMWSNPISRQAFVKFKFADSAYNMTTGAAGTATAQVFRGNAPYDPDFTGVGVQPYGWDLWAQASNFQRYLCFASKIKVNFAVTGSTYAFIVSVVPHRQSALTYTDPNDLRVIPGAKQVRLNSNDRTNRTIVAYSTTRFNYPEFDKKNANFSQDYNAVPNYVWHWHVISDTTSEAAIKAALMDVQITYYVQLFRKDDDNES